jgi:hypothetical protein
VPDTAELSSKFRRRHGYEPDFNTPQSFNEKMWRRIHFEHDPLYRVYGNKRFAPDYARSKVRSGLDFAERYGVWQRVDTCQLAELPDSFILKGSHGSGVNRIVRHRNNEDLAKVAGWFNERATTNRNAQGVCDPDAVIFAEELLEGPDGGVPTDYKFHCFHAPGDGAFRWLLQLHTERFGDHTKTTYGEDLSPVDFSWGNHTPNRVPLSAPDNFDAMVRIAQTLSEDFDYVRIDLYNVRGRVVFGEITPFHSAGLSVFEPAEWDLTIGRLWEPHRRRDPADQAG